MAFPNNGNPYEGFIQSDIVRIHFRAAGEGHLLIFVHGHPDNSTTWKAQVAEFSKSYTVICPTQRGFPPSDVPSSDEAYALGALVGDLEDDYSSPKHVDDGLEEAYLGGLKLVKLEKAGH